MNEPEDFSDLLERITPYIHMEDVRTARREEAERKDKRNTKQWKNRTRAEMEKVI